jgi:hypothetical protein
MDHDGGGDVVTPGELLGNSSSLVAGRGVYADGRSVRASVTGHRRIVPPQPGSSDQVGLVRVLDFLPLGACDKLVQSWLQRSTVEVVGHKAHGAVPQPGSIVIARVRSVCNHRSVAAVCMSYVCSYPQPPPKKFYELSSFSKRLMMGAIDSSHSTF